MTGTREQRLPCGFKTLGPRLGKKESLDSLGNGESLKAFEKENTRIKSVLQKTRRAAALGGKAGSRRQGPKVVGISRARRDESLN